MGILMISLDKKILDEKSSVAERMKVYGQKNNLYIIIPTNKEQPVELSSSVRVFPTGGNKIRQFLRIYFLGRKLIRENSIELITTQDPFFTGLAGVWLKKKTGKNLEIQVHGDFFGVRYYQGLAWKIRLWLGKRNLRQADKIRVVGERIRQSLLKLGLKEEIMEVRPVQIDVDQIQKYQPKFKLHEKYAGYEKIFLVLSRLDLIKNIKWLIDVFSEVIKQKNNWLLLIVGSGRDETNIKLQNNIKLESWTNDPVSYLKTADCLLFPSLSEGYGLVVMEAAVAGTPVIMNDVGVANYELKPGPKVTIVPVNDKDKFIQAILSI